MAGLLRVRTYFRAIDVFVPATFRAWMLPGLNAEAALSAATLSRCATMSRLLRRAAQVRDRGVGLLGRRLLVIGGCLQAVGRDGVLLGRRVQARGAEAGAGDAADAGEACVAGCENSVLGADIAARGGVRLHLCHHHSLGRREGTVGDADVNRPADADPVRAQGSWPRCLAC